MPEFYTKIPNSNKFYAVTPCYKAFFQFVFFISPILSFSSLFFRSSLFRKSSHNNSNHIILKMSSSPSTTFYDIIEKDATGSDVSFRKFEGKVVYGVNVASECGYTERFLYFFSFLIF